MSNLIPLVILDNEPRIDSRVIAEQLGVTHQNTRELIQNFQADFQEFGILRFETGEIKGRGQPEKFALLNEDQSYLLLTYTKNTEQARALKKRLVHAFSHYRRLATTQPVPAQPAAPQPSTEYLTANDQDNIQRLIWSIAHPLRHERAMSYATWYALRQATGCPSPHRFEVRHLPIIATELRRILEIAVAYQHHQYTMERELIKRAIRSREIPSIVVGRLRAIESEWLIDATKWQAKLDDLHLHDLDTLALRRPAGCDHSQYAEPAWV